MARYTITVERMALRKASLMSVANGADQRTGNGGGTGGSGGGSGKGIWEDGYEMMKGWVFDIEAVRGEFPSEYTGLPAGGGSSQSATGEPMKKWYQCSFASGSVRITKHTIVVEDATFFCTQVSGKHQAE